MADKYLGVNNTTGNTKEVEGTTVSTGVAEAGKIPALDAAGKLDNSLMPTGLGADMKVLPASEGLDAGDLVNVWDDAGTTKVRKADGSSNKPANGFVKANVSSGANASVYFEGVNDQLTGLTGGSNYFLSATVAGEASTAIPTTAGNIVQAVGKALSTTELSFEPSHPIERA